MEEELHLGLAMALVFFAIVPVFQALVAYLLTRVITTASRTPMGVPGALKERFVFSLFKLAGGVMISVLAWNRLLSLQFSDGLILWGFVAAIAAVSIPSFVWLYMYYTNKL